MVADKRVPTVEKQDPWYMEMLFALGMFGFALYMNSELKGLEQGTVDSVKLWVPLVWLYHHFGRISVVAVFGLLGVALLVMGARKLIARK